MYGGKVEVDEQSEGGGYTPKNQGHQGLARSSHITGTIEWDIDCT